MEYQIQKIITTLFVSTDQRAWTAVEACFAEEVLLDYTSMAGGSPARLSPREITESWKSIMPGFEATHHQLGNFMITVNGDKAKAFCYGTATHYLPDAHGNVWTVAGTYSFELVRKDSQWKITSMQFNFKYQDGNTALPEKAQRSLNN